MTLRIPDDLPALRALAAQAGPAIAMVYHEEPLEGEWEGPELPVVRIDVEPDIEYVQFFTLPNASDESLNRALSFGAVVARLERLSERGPPRELFWVSGHLPIAEDSTPDTWESSVRLALPLAALAGNSDPPRVAFIARRTA
jgi:hypothetical protein